MSRRNYRSRSPSRSRSPKRQTNGAVWAVFGILIGLLIAATLYLKYAGAPHPTTPAHTQKTTTATKTNSTKKSQPAPSTGPEFDFYTVLPKTQVTPNKVTQSTSKPSAAPVTPTAPAATTTPPTSDNTTATSLVPTTSSTPAPATTATPANITNTTPQSATPTAPTTNSTKNTYWLQIISLKNFADADRYKAELTMSGLDVTIQSYTKSGQTYNRVVMGPYDSHQAAQQQQAQLKQKQINSIVVKAQ